MNGALDRWITGNYGEDHPDNQPATTKEDTMDIETLNQDLIKAGIPTTIENMGGDVMACWIGVWDGDFLILPSEVDDTGFMLGLYDRDGDEIEFVDEISFQSVVDRIIRSL